MVGKHGMVLPTLSDIKSDLDTDRFPTRLSGALSSIPSSLGLPPVPDPKHRPFHGVVIGGWEENHRETPKRVAIFSGKNGEQLVIYHIRFRVSENWWKWMNMNKIGFQCLPMFVFRSQKISDATTSHNRHRHPISGSRTPDSLLGGFVSSCFVYPLVNCHIAMENHHFEWENPLFLWPFSIAMLVHQRVMILEKMPSCGWKNAINQPIFDAWNPTHIFMLILRGMVCYCLF